MGVHAWVSIFFQTLKPVSLRVVRNQGPSSLQRDLYCHQHDRHVFPPPMLCLSRTSRSALTLKGFFPSFVLNYCKIISLSLSFLVLRNQGISLKGQGSTSQDSSMAMRPLFHSRVPDHPIHMWGCKRLFQDRVSQPHVWAKEHIEGLQGI